MNSRLTVLVAATAAALLALSGCAAGVERREDRRDDRQDRRDDRQDRRDDRRDDRHDFSGQAQPGADSPAQPRQQPVG